MLFSLTCWLLLISYFCVMTFSYFFLNRIRDLFGYHLGMNMAMASSGVIGLAGGINLLYLFPTHYTLVVITTTLLSIGVGTLFGAMVDYQTLFTGIISGIMSGLMGPMLGAHADQPFLLMIFTSVLVYLSFGLMCFSVRS